MKSSTDTQRELFIVLGSLFIFSFLLTFANWFSSHTPHDSINTHVAVEQAQESILDLHSPKEALAFINDLLESRSTEKIVTLLRNLAPERINQLLGLIAHRVEKGSTNFGLLDLYELFAGAALVHGGNENYIDGLVKILLGLKSFYQEPFLYVMGVHPEYHKSFGSFVKSFQKAGVDINKLISSAGKRVAETKDMQRLKQFLSNQLPFTPETKKQLVWEIVMARAADDIDVLKQHGIDLNVQHEGKTPLILAVMNNDEATVKALLKVGVIVNTIADDAIGSALQQALVKKYLPIELLLREHGAHE